MSPLRRRLPGLAIVAVVCLLSTGVVWFVKGLMDGSPPSGKRVVQVNLIRPPPPPPPDVPPPPPPEVKEEVKLPDPEPVAETNDVPDMPPGDLGLDADGVAGSDAFGLMGRRGGRDLIGGDGAYGWYAGRVKDEILEFLSRRDDVRGTSYTIVVSVWIGEDGRLGRYQLAKSTGNPTLDATLTSALDAMHAFAEAPPSGMPQPVRLRIVSRA
jgi:protein TonB